MTENIGRKTVVIEGEGGAGKTTTAQGLARLYGLKHINTGTYFRTAVAGMLLEGVQFNKVDEVVSYVTSANYIVETDQQGVRSAINGLEVTRDLQDPLITKISSVIGGAAVAALHLEKLFNKEVVESDDIVVEGKNLAKRFKGVKDLSYLKAKPYIRAHRKLKLAHYLGRLDYTMDQAQADIAANDARDSKNNLLVVPANTQIIDTSYLTPQEVIKQVARHAGLE